MVHANFKLADPSLLLTTGWINDKQVKAVSGRKPFDVIDPATGEAWTAMEAMDEDDTDAAIAAAAAAFPSFSAIPARQRARMILELDRLVRENKEDLAILDTMESGKSLVESRAEIDYAGAYRADGGLGDDNGVMARWASVGARSWVTSTIFSASTPTSGLHFVLHPELPSRSYNSTNVC